MWERGDRRLPRLNLGPGVSDTHPRSRRGRARTELYTPTAKRDAETGSSACYLSASCSLARGRCVALCLLFSRVSFSGLATWLIIISPSCLTYRHTSARLGLNRTEARLSGFGNCLLIHLNRIHESLRSLSLFRAKSGSTLGCFFLSFFLSFIWSEGPHWVKDWLTALMGRAEQISQLNEAMEEKGLSLCSSLSLYSVPLKKPLREIKWPWLWKSERRRQMQCTDTLEQIL